MSLHLRCRFCLATTEAEALAWAHDVPCPKCSLPIFVAAEGDAQVSLAALPRRRIKPAGPRMYRSQWLPPAEVLDDKDLRIARLLAGVDMLIGENDRLTGVLVANNVLDEDAELRASDLYEQELNARFAVIAAIKARCDVSMKA